MAIGAFLTGAGIRAGEIAHGWVKNEQDMELYKDKKNYDELIERRSAEYKQMMARDQDEWKYNTDKRRLTEEEKDPNSEAGAKRREREAKNRGLLAKESMENMRMGSGEVELPNGDIAHQAEDGTIIITDKDNTVTKGTFKNLDEYERSRMSIDDRQKLDKGAAEVREREARASQYEAVADWTKGGRGKDAGASGRKEFNKEWSEAIKGYGKYFESKDDMGNVKMDAVGMSAFRRMVEANKHQNNDPNAAADNAINAINKIRDKSMVNGTLDQAAYQRNLNALFAGLEKREPKGIVAPTKEVPKQEAKAAAPKKSDEPKKSGEPKKPDATKKAAPRSELEKINDEIVAISKQLAADNEKPDTLGSMHNIARGHKPNFRMDRFERKTLESKLDKLYERKQKLRK